MPAKDECRLYRTCHEFLTVANSELVKGEMVSNFYIADLDYFSEESTDNEVISRLNSTVKLVSYLRKLANYIDSARASTERLVFIRTEAIGSTKAITIDLAFLNDITEENVGGCLSEVELLVSEDYFESAHFVEKKAIFNQSLVEYFEKFGSDISLFEIVSRWAQFIKHYNNNLDIYVSGFSFHIARKELTDYVFSLSERYSELISNIYSKVLAVPVSLGAIALMFRFTNIGIHIVFLIAAILTSCLTFYAISSQRRQAEILKDSKEYSVDSLSKNYTDLPPDMLCQISSVKNRFEKEHTHITNSITIFSLLSWSPAVIALVILVITDERYLAAWRGLRAAVL